VKRVAGTRVFAVRGRRLGKDALGTTVAALQSGGVVIFPTDTVYGMAAGIFRPGAIRRIYRLKGRSLKKALPFLAADLAQALALVEPPDRKLRALLKKFWPGPLTVVFKTSTLGRWTTGGKETLAVRVPDCPVTRAILRAMGQPLAVTSANRSGRPDAVTGAAARREFEGEVDVIVDGGRCPRGVASTVLDVSSTVWTLAREGAVPQKDLLKFL
jgi:L-threonylcarbamoyladenylate synthase